MNHSGDAEDTALEVDRSLLQLLTDAQAAMSRLFEARTAALGLTRTQWRVGGGIYRVPGLTQTELSNWLGLARSPIGKVIDKLEAQGLVERRPDPEDRRINRLYPTEAMRPLVAPATEISAALEEEVLDAVAGAQVFLKRLEQLTQGLEQRVEVELQSE